MNELLKQLGGGAVSTGLFLLLYWLVRYLVLRFHARTRLTLAEITATGQREERSLEAEGAAFKYLELALERSQKGEEDLREKIKAIEAANDTRVGTLTLLLAQEQQAKNEALKDAFNTRTLAQSLQTRHDFEREAMLADLNAARWHESDARLWIRAVWAQMVAEGLDPPPTPYWVDEQEDENAPRRLTEG